jgi:anti-sigma regulatory factor (Ser/Thr protein kinase)
MSSDGRPEQAASRSADELVTRLAGAALRGGVNVDSTFAPLACARILGGPGHLVEVRHQLEHWAANAGLRASTVADLVLAAYEALANAAEHAYPSRDGPVDLVAARTTDGRVLVIVSDYGRWRPPPADPGFRGRGLQMITALTRRVQVQPGPHGTTVHMEWEV